MYLAEVWEALHFFKRTFACSSGLSISNWSRLSIASGTVTQRATSFRIKEDQWPLYTLGEVMYVGVWIHHSYVFVPGVLDLDLLSIPSHHLLPIKANSLHGSWTFRYASKVTRLFWLWLRRHIILTVKIWNSTFKMHEEIRKEFSVDSVNLIVFQWNKVLCWKKFLRLFSPEWKIQHFSDFGEFEACALHGIKRRVYANEKGDDAEKMPTFPRPARE